MILEKLLGKRKSLKTQRAEIIQRPKEQYIAFIPPEGYYLKKHQRNNIFHLPHRKDIILIETAVLNYYLSVGFICSKKRTFIISFFWV